MSRFSTVTLRAALALVVVAAMAPLATPAAQSAAPPQRLSTQKVDEQYTALIKQHLTDARINTELVDHLPASDKVPTPLKFPAVGHIAGQPGVLTYAKDIHAYMKAIADSGTGRAKFWTIGQTEEGRQAVAHAAVLDARRHVEGENQHVEQRERQPRPRPEDEVGHGPAFAHLPRVQHEAGVEEAQLPGQPRADDEGEEQGQRRPPAAREPHLLPVRRRPQPAKDVHADHEQQESPAEDQGACPPLLLHHRNQIRQHQIRGGQSHNVDKKSQESEIEIADLFHSGPLYQGRE